MNQADIERVKAIKTAYEAELLCKANVVAVGIGLVEENTGKPCIVVSVSHKVSACQLAPKDLVPRQIEGILVAVREVGELSAF